MKPIVLDATTKKLQMIMSGAAATTNPSYAVSYADVTTVFTEGNLNGALNGTTAVDIAPAPAASTRRVVSEIVLYNADSAAVTVTFSLNDNGTLRIIKSIYLTAGQTWEMSTQTAIDGAPGVAGPASDYLSVLTGAEISITGTDTATISRQHVASGSSAYTITLPAASGNSGKFLSFRFTNSAITTLDGASAETIDTVTTRAYYQNDSCVLYCDGSNWHTVSQNTASLVVEAFFDSFVWSSATSISVSTSAMYNFSIFQTSGANGTTMERAIYLNKGSFVCSILGVANNINGKIDWTLNGVSQTTGQDWNAGSATYGVIKTFTLTVPYTGLHRIKGTVNGTSNTNYYALLTKMTISPTAY